MLPYWLVSKQYSLKTVDFEAFAAAKQKDVGKKTKIGINVLHNTSKCSASFQFKGQGHWTSKTSRNYRLSGVHVYLRAAAPAAQAADCKLGLIHC